jgi:hypothetical protein
MSYEEEQPGTSFRPEKVIPWNRKRKYEPVNKLVTQKYSQHVKTENFKRQNCQNFWNEVPTDIQISQGGRLPIREVTLDNIIQYRLDHGRCGISRDPNYRSLYQMFMTQRKTADAYFLLRLLAVIMGNAPSIRQCLYNPMLIPLRIFLETELHPYLKEYYKMDFYGFLQNNAFTDLPPVAQAPLAPSDPPEPPS